MYIRFYEDIMFLIHFSKYATSQKCGAHMSIGNEHRSAREVTCLVDGKRSTDSCNEVHVPLTAPVVNIYNMC